MASVQSQIHFGDFLALMGHVAASTLAEQNARADPPNASESELGRSLGAIGQLFGHILGSAFSEDREENSAVSPSPSLGQRLGEIGQTLGQELAQSAARNGFSDTLTHIIDGVSQDISEDQTETFGTPPASESALQSLPKVGVAACDLDANPSCAVCLSDFVAGNEATRLPCGHLYHEGCIKQWLGVHNQCPVCRYELPTDNMFYERLRKARMANRKLQVSQRELEQRSSIELRHFAEHLQLDVSGCIEKDDLIELIASSDQVKLLRECRDDESRASQSSAGRHEEP